MSPASINHLHPDFDDLSANVDGEAPEWDTHVAGCADCQATVARIRRMSGMVAGPVPPAASSARETRVARALEAFGDAESMREDAEVGVADGSEWAPTPEPASMPASMPASVHRTSPSPSTAGVGRVGSPTPIGSARSRRRGGSGMWVGVGSAAAVLVAFVLGVSVLTGGGTQDSGTVAAGAPPAQERTAEDVTGESDALTSGAESAGGGVGGAGGVDGGDLGEISDETALASRARPALVQRASAAAADDTGSGVAGVAGLSPASGPAPTSRFIGTRPCEMEARSARPDLGTVVYHATGRVDGVPVVVLGFAAGPTSAPVTLLALAQQEGCRVVLEAAGP